MLRNKTHLSKILASGLLQLYFCWQLAVIFGQENTSSIMKIVYNQREKLYLGMWQL